MADDERLAAALREELAGHGRLQERRMFGALCLMLDGNMVCGVLARGALLRVGKPNMEAALALGPVRPARMGARVMGGMVEADAEAVLDPDLRASLLALALDHVGGLPPK